VPSRWVTLSYQGGVGPREIKTAKSYKKKLPKIRGGAQRSKVWLRIHFFSLITYFRPTESKSAFKTILSHQEVIFFFLATSITTP